MVYFLVYFLSLFGDVFGVLFLSLPVFVGFSLVPSRRCSDFCSAFSLHCVAPYVTDVARPLLKRSSLTQITLLSPLSTQAYPAG